MQNKDSTKKASTGKPSSFSSLASVPLLFLTACQVLTYTSPTGERFTRSSLGATTSIRSLAVETTTNGLRRVELRGYENDTSKTLGLVTGAAVKAALDSLRP